MRDLVVAMFMLLILPLAMRSTFSAVFLWVWSGMVGINGLMYGFMASVNIVQLFAIISLISFWFRKEWMSAPYFTWRGLPTVLIILIAHGAMCAALAFNGVVDNAYLFQNMLKTVLLCLVIMTVANSPDRLHHLMIGVVIGLGYHALTDGLKYVGSGGGHRALGIGKFGDNNHYGMMLVMIIPLLVHLVRFARHKLAQLASGCMIAITVLAVLATNSRGALITILLSVFWFLLFSKRKIMGVVITTALGGLGISMAPDSWFERMNTIQSADEDHSFMGRVTAWKRASAIAVDNPVFGGGYHAGQSWSIFEKYRYEPGLLGMVETPDVNRPAASHSIYFETMGDLGFVGLILFLLTMGSTFYYGFKTYRLVSKDGPDADWVRSLVVALTSSMVAYMVGGAALSVAYYELPYYLVTITFVLYRLMLVNRSTSRRLIGVRA